MKIALAQMLSTDDVPRNIEIIREYTALAAQRGARLVVFPEAAMLALSGSLYDGAAQHEVTFRSALAEIARENHITLVAGGFAPVQLQDEWELRVHNNLYVFDQYGAETIYTKIHLYDAFGFRESDTVKAGEELKLITVEGLKIGLATCYDVRFPRLFTDYARAGAQAVIVAASWAGGEGKVQQWQILTSARALDANLFILAADQASPATAQAHADVTRPTGVGYSRVVSPFGRTLAEAGEGPEILLAQLDVAEQVKAREQLPVLANARLGY